MGARANGAIVGMMTSDGAAARKAGDRHNFPARAVLWKSE